MVRAGWARFVGQDGCAAVVQPGLRCPQRVSADTGRTALRAGLVEGGGCSGREWKDATGTQEESWATLHVLVSH